VPRALADSVVVVTGASSGIGRASALAFAERGARVVVAARREEALRGLASECGDALAVPTDVTDEAAVQELARRAVETYGRIDVWFNNAGVYLLGRFEDTPPEAFRQVVETNFFGAVHGARAALPRFRSQGNGTLINTASILGRVAGPYLSAYSASKFAIRGLTGALRQELRGAGDIHACAVLPAPIDTPLFRHTANYTGRAVKPPRPVYDADQVARAVVSLAERPRKEVIVGGSGRMLAVQQRLSLRLGEWGSAVYIEADTFADGSAPPTDGNLYAPVRGRETVGDGWRSNVVLRSAPALLAAALPAAGLIWLRR